MNDYEDENTYGIGTQSDDNEDLDHVEYGVPGSQKLDRFDLEHQIMDCWNIVGDINILYKNLMDKDLTKDQIANVLLGLKELYEMKFSTAFETFESLIKSGNID